MAKLFKSTYGSIRQVRMESKGYKTLIGGKHFE